MSNYLRKRERERGLALLLFVVLFLATSLTLVLTIGKGAYEDLARYRVLASGYESYYASEAGIEDAIHRMRDSDNYSSSESFTLKTSAVTVTRTQHTDYFDFFATATTGNAIRNSEVSLAIGDGTSFNFGLQSGNGGILMSNNSKVRGNVFSNGTVEGQGSATVYGNIVSAGSGGLVDSIYATGTVWSHSIDGATIGVDAYYYATSTKTATVVSGVSHPGSADQSSIPLPIEDSQVADWKNGIETTGTVISATSTQCSSGTYTIDTHTSLGNVHIMCNVEMKKQGASTNITLTGPVWISGNLSFSQGPNIIASSSLGSRSVQIIVDNESNHATSSTISVNQSTTFTSGNASSYVLLLSMNDSAEMGGTEMAIDLAQSANGKVLVYAGHGLINMGNSISLKEVTAHEIEISNGAEIIYESGLMNLLFTSGPGGGYTVTSWKEVE